MRGMGMRVLGLIVLVGFVGGGLSGCARSVGAAASVPAVAATHTPADAHAASSEVYVPVALVRRFDTTLQADERVELVDDAPTIAPAPPPVVVAPAVAAPGRRCWSGCGLPCEEGIQSCFLFRGVVGLSTWYGDDPAADCSYGGLDVGRTWCGSKCNGCFGLDLFYRRHTGQFDVDPASKDGGTWHHVGIKATYEKSFGGSRFSWFAGAGPESYWTEDYLEDDSGFGVFGELGVGFVLSTHWRVRAGFNAHGMDTGVGRKSAADVDQSRWLWVVAPVIEIQGGF